MQAINLQDIRKSLGIKQSDVAKALGIPQSTYSYKENNGGFTEIEKETIAQYLKTDMQTISWPIPSFNNSQLQDAKSADTIKKLQQENAELRGEIKALKEMIDRLMLKA